MASVSTYLNFMGNTFEAFEFYRKVFGTEFRGEVLRNRDMPGMPSTMTEAELDGIMHIELPILGGHVLMATDMLASMGHELRVGNNTTINLEPDTREETERLFALTGNRRINCQLTDRAATGRPSGRAPVRRALGRRSTAPLR